MLSGHLMFWFSQFLILIVGLLGRAAVRSWIRSRWPKLAERHLDIVLIALLFLGIGIASAMYLQGRSKSSVLAQKAAAFNLSVFQRTGRLGPLYSRKEQEEMRRATIELLEKNGVSEEDQDRLFAEWYRGGAFDYTVIIRNSIALTPELRQSPEINSLWRGPEGSPTPEEFEIILTRHKILTPEIMELISDYRYYLVHHEHRRPEVWFKNAN